MALGHWLLIGLIVLLWMQFALQDNSADSFGSSAGIKPVYNPSPQTNTTLIAQYHIFGSAQKLIEIPLSSGETNLSLILNGTMSNDDEQTGLAYISNAQGGQEKFLVGDKIFNSATLKEIHKTYVVLQHNGKHERLSLRENSQSNLGQSNTTSRKSIKKSPSSYIKHLNGGQQVSWQETMNQQKFNPAKISQIVSSSKLITDQMGNIQGIKVSNMADSGILKQFGFKSNDIITAVNGNKVSASNLLSIKQTLEKNPNATVTIKRNGKVLNIQVNLSSL